MKVVSVERIIVDVPFTPRQQKITQRTVYNWSILELCKVTTGSGHVGWGETVIHYTYGRVTDASVEKVMGQSPAEWMNDDSLGAGLQIRQAVNRPIAMHFGNPPYITVVREGVCARPTPRASRLRCTTGRRSSGCPG